MSGGEGIVFDEVRHREPQKARRPDSDPRFASLAYGVPAPGDLPVFIDRIPADAIERHALRDTSVELGGILLGKECVDEATGQPFVWISNSLEAKHYQNTQASFTYTHETWEEITREREQRFPDLDIVGWYHTHPDFGIFLSGLDLFIHRNFFPQPLQVAYVVDPVRQERGFFQWRGGEIAPISGFHLIAGRGDRIALARLVNDLEQIHNTEVPSGLSPRLEAELIAMFARPPAPPPAPPAHSLVLYTLIGAFLGILGLSTALWMGNLQRSIDEQSQAIREIQVQHKDALGQSAYLQEVALKVAGNSLTPELVSKANIKLGQDLSEQRAELKQLGEANRVLQSELTGHARERDALGQQVEKLTAQLTESRDRLAENERELKKIQALEGEPVAKAASTDAQSWFRNVAWAMVGVAVSGAALGPLLFNTRARLKELQAAIDSSTPGPGKPQDGGSPPPDLIMGP